jgi:acyl-CoA thioesterase-1
VHLRPAQSKDLQLSVALRHARQYPQPSQLTIYTIYVDVRRRLIVSLLPLLLAAHARAADRPILVCYGDSITAGYGLEPGKSYPDFLQEKLDSRGYHYKVDNQGTSGATTKDAVATLPSILRLHPEIVIVEFGGNDGLRGLPLDQTRQNLDQVLTTLESAHIKILLAGITLPPNYGSDYIHTFEQVFSDLAAKHHTAFVPMIYKDLIHIPDSIQQDGIHPTAKGSTILADTLLAALKPLLRK